MPLTEGEILDGKYRAERVLGEGGMGYVVAAWHEQLEQRVALKLLRPETLAEPAFVTRFHREARAAAKIKSEHVCRVLDVGLVPVHGPYMVMEYLEGQDLQSLLRRVGPRPVEQAVTWLLHASHAIAEAHGRGIVHRDLKPANLFLADRPDGAPIVKVLDFGISKVIGASGAALAESLTATSMFMGSYAYMSPEQARNAKDVDGRVDVWALGAILQKILTGSTPFLADSAAAYVAKIVADPPARIRDKRPEVPVELEAVVLRCLEKDRSKRFGTVGELARALSPFGPGHEGLVLAIERLSSQPLEAGRASGPGGPIAEPAPSSRGLDAAPSPLPAMHATDAATRDTRGDVSNTPTKPLDFASMGAAIGRAVPPSATPASGSAMAPPSGPGLTPLSSGGLTPGSGPGVTPVSGLGLTPISAAGLGGAPASPLPLPAPDPGATPSGLGATPGTAAAWAPVLEVPEQAQSPRLVVWGLLAAAALLLTVAVVLIIGLAATDSPTPRAAATGTSAGSHAEGRDRVTTQASAHTATGGPVGGHDAPRASAAATATVRADASGSSPAPSASVSATAKPKATGRWDPFAHP